MVGAAIWDFLHVLRDFDPAHVGFHYDIGHMTNAGGNGTWALNLRARLDRTSRVSAKNSGDGIHVSASGRWSDRSRASRVASRAADRVRMARVVLGVAGSGPGAGGPPPMAAGPMGGPPPMGEGAGRGAGRGGGRSGNAPNGPESPAGAPDRHGIYLNSPEILKEIRFSTGRSRFRPSIRMAERKTRRIRSRFRERSYSAQ